MCRTIILLFTILSLSLADFYFAGTARKQSSGGDFGRSGTTPEDATKQYFGTTLDVYRKPTFNAAASPTSVTNFAVWYNTPFGQEANLRTYTSQFVSGGSSLATWDFDGFAPTGVVTDYFTFELHGMVWIPSTAATWSFNSKGGELFVFVSGTRRDLTTLSGTHDFLASDATLSTSSLGNPGTYQPISIFYAYRNSNWGAPRIRITLSENTASPAFCEGSTYHTEFVGHYPFNDTNLYGAASGGLMPAPTTTAANTLRVVSASSFTSSGAAWANNRFRVENGWKTAFTFTFSGNPVSVANQEGFAFVVQSSGLNVQGGAGPLLGYDRINRSLAIEFDTKFESATDVTFTSGNMVVEVHTGYSGTTTADQTTALPRTPSTFPTFAITAGTDYTVLIEYQKLSSGSTDNINVWLDTAANMASALYTRAPTATFTVNRANYLSMFNNLGNTAYMGFTSSTFDPPNGAGNIDIKNWRVWTTPVAAVRSTVTPATGWSTDIARAVAPATKFTLTLFDVCNTRITYGGVNSVVATLRSDPFSGNPVVGNTLVTDKSDGSYDITWWHRLAELVRLSVNVNVQNIKSFAPQYDIVNITAAPISAASSTWAFNGSPATRFNSCNTTTPCNVDAGEVLSFTITARDTFGNPNANPTNLFQVRFSGDLDFTLASSTPPTYRFTGYATRALPNTAIQMLYNTNDIGGQANPAITPSQTTGSGPTPTPIPSIYVLAATPPNLINTAASLTGPGYTPGVVAGQVGTMTLKPFDQFNNPIINTAQANKFNSLLLPTIRISCDPSTITPDTQARCNAAGWTYPAVTADPVTGTWTLSYQTNLAHVYVLDIQYNGTSLPNLARIVVSTDIPFGAMTLIYPTPPFYVGSTGSGTFQARDQFGNYIRNQVSRALTSTFFTVSMGAQTTGPAFATYECDSNAAPATATAITLNRCSYVSSGLWSFTFSPTLLDTYVIRVGYSVNGNNQTNILVDAGPPYAPNCHAFPVNTPLVAGEVYSIDVQSRDEYNNIRVNYDDSSAFDVRYVGVGFLPQGLVIGAPSRRSAPNSANYTMTYKTNTAGAYTLAVVLLESPVAEFRPDPAPITVIPSYTVADNSTVSGSGASGAFQLTRTEFIWQSIDSYGNLKTDPATDTTDSFNVTVPRSAGNGNPIITPLGGGRYNISYVAPAHASPYVYDIFIVVTSTNPFTGLPVVTSKILGPLPTSNSGTSEALVYYGTMTPQSLTSASISSTIGGNLGVSNIYGRCLMTSTGPDLTVCNGVVPRVLTTMTAGVPNCFNITDRDSNVTAQYTGFKRIPPVTFVVNFNLQTDPTVTFSGTGDSTGVTQPTVDVSQVCVTPQQAGTYNVYVLANGVVNTTETNRGITVPVRPGPLYAPQSDVNNFIPVPVLTAGDPFSYVLIYRDRYGNRLGAPADNTQQYTLNFQLRNSIGTVLTSSVMFVAPGTNPAAIVDSDGDGNVTVTFRPTLAGQMRVFTYDNAPPGREMGSDSGLRYQIVVNPGPIARTCVGQVPTALPTDCPNTTTTTQVAGIEFTLPVYVADQYGNPITNPNQTFSVMDELNGALVLGAGSGPSSTPGLYNLMITLNQRVVYEDETAPRNNGNLLTITALSDPISNPAGDRAISVVRVKVDPADVNDTLSHIDGVPPSVVAGTTITPRLILRDRFNNPWFNDVTKVTVSIQGPNIARDLTVALAGADGLAQSNPFANYSIRYTPTRATPQRPGDLFVPYTISFRVLGVTVNPPGNKMWNVTAGPAVASKTIYSKTLRLTDGWLAGDLNNLTVQLVDTYNNYLLIGGDQVNVTFLNDAPVCDANGNITITGHESFDFARNVTDNGDGTYVIYVNTTRAGRYTASLTVAQGGVPTVTRACPPLDTQFQINPLAIYPPRCFLSGPAVEDPRNNIAGEIITFDINMVDKYDNNVCIFCEKPPCPCLSSIVQGPAVGPWSGPNSVYPISPQDQICGNPPDPANWIDLTSYQYLSIVPYQNISTSTPDQFGSYRVEFEAEKARRWKLVVTLDIIGSWETVGDQCVDIEISPSYIADFNITQSSTLWAGIPDAVVIMAWDRFNNSVHNGTHYFEAYSFFQGTNINRYAVRSQSAFDANVNDHTLTNVFHHGGSYNATVTLRNSWGPVATVPKPKSFVVTVKEATCAGETSSTSTVYRCDPRGPCRADVTTCPGYSACEFYCAGGGANYTDRASGCSSSACGSPCLTGESLCSWGNMKYCSSTSGCGAAPDADRNPGWSADLCSGLYRNDTSGCPDTHVCNPGLVPCPDGISCVRNPADCWMAPTTCSGSTPVRCQDGRCVGSRFDCPTPVVCAVGVVCPDGSCQNDKSMCPSIYDCYAPNSHRCQDGSCRASFADCPSRVTCPPGWLLCTTGHCVMTATECSNDTCPLNNVRCPDGACKPTFDLCASGVTCPLATPVLCSDRTCATKVSLCKMPMSCPDSFVQCPRGTCAPTKDQCPTDVICPAATPVLCSNGLCTNSVNNCAPNFRCPLNRPFRCPDSSCANRYEDCPTSLNCPSNAPVRCASGGCVPSSQMCPDQLQTLCPANWTHCPGGICAMAPGECPTAIACQGSQIRCGDGSCRTSCVGVTRENVRACPDGLVECPDYETGYSCAANYASCPRAPACPPERPVRCADRTCRVMIAHCPPEAQYNPSVVSSTRTCGGNTWSTAQCGQVPTCPMSMPAMCWDQTCRLTARDCPAEPICTLEAKDPRNLKPYLCSSGSCVTRLYNCLADAPCSSPAQVRCPGHLDTSPSCADTLADCVDLTNTTTDVAICPFDRTRCRDGSCRDSCPVLASCPHFVSYLCPDGQCVRTVSECSDKDSCPVGTDRCSDGSCASTCPSTPTCTSGLSLCADGSCRSTCPTTLQKNGCGTNQTRCADGFCGECEAPVKSGQAVVLANSCPGTRPYRCANGYCAVSSAYCPHFPQDAACATGKPFRCADMSCALTGMSCPIIQPCPCPLSGGVKTCWTRCNDGRCVQTPDMCSFAKRCQDPYPFMCANGLCAASNGSCINERTGCPADMVKCDDGWCATSYGSCPTPSLYAGNGCPKSVGPNPYRCWNGECAAGPGSCSVPEGCNSGDPSSPNCALRTKTCPGGQVRCADGSCNAQASCKTAQGCDLDTPFRCVDGSCAKYPADGTMSPDRCAPIVMCSDLLPIACADGTCVADKRLCPAFYPCPTGKNLCPNDMTCRDVCPTNVGCPAGAPTLCPSGACVRSYRECGPMPGEVCDATAPFKCFDGSCKAKPLDCVSIQLLVRTGSAASTGGTGHDNQACTLSTEALCWNGACVPKAQINEYCPPVPSCPNEYPLRCADGSCINSTAGQTCEAVGACTKTSYPDGSRATHRCEDGTCRYQCPLYQGCPTTAPLMCPSKAIYCVAANSPASCAGAQEICMSNCNRDTPATPQTVFVPSVQDITLDVSVDKYASVQTWMEIPAGAFGGAAQFKIQSITADMMKNGFIRVNRKAVKKTFQEVAVGVPFTCTVTNAVASPPQAHWPLNITVFGNVDKQKFSTDGATRPSVVTPCPWIGKFALSGVTNLNCSGSVTFTDTTITIAYNAANDGACGGQLASTKGNILSVVDNGDYYDTVWNISTSAADNSTLCLTLSNVATLRRVYFTFADLTTCPPNEASDPGTAALRATPDNANTDACAAASAANVIDPVDICFGYFETRTREFKCFAGYYERTEADFRSDPENPTTTGFPAWAESSGRRSTLMRGRLSMCQAGQYYGFYYVPLPPPPTKTSRTQTFWEKYGGIILGVGIGGTVFLLLLFYALSRLIRYRRKYLEEKEEAEKLRTTAADMAENFGGLGVYDEDVTMVTNPLVIQFNEQKKKLDELDSNLKVQEERDAQEMDRLDKERQAILKEMERIKSAIQQQNAQKKAQRVDDAPAVSTGGAAQAQTDWGGSTGGETQSFEPQQMGAKPKKRDL